MSPAVARVLDGVLRRVRDVLGTGITPPEDPREARLLPGAAPATIEETLIALALAGPGRLRVDALVATVSTPLYREELRQGGGAVDLSLLGPRIFAPLVVSTLEGGDGRLWRLSTAAPTNERGGAGGW